MENIIYHTTEKNSTEQHLDNLGLKYHCTNLGNTYEFTIWYSKKDKSKIKEFIQ